MSEADGLFARLLVCLTDSTRATVGSVGTARHGTEPNEQIT